MIRQPFQFIGLVFWLISSAFMPLSASSQTTQEIAKYSFGSVVLLVMEDQNGQPLSLGSGFFVGNGEIASNLHVVAGAAKGYAKQVGQKTKYDITGLIGIDVERDLVILKIQAGPVKPLEIGDSNVTQVGDTVYAIGNPQGLEGTFSQGIVSSIRELGSDRLLQITAPIAPGSSGGPVLNARGEVIGVSVATFNGGQNLNFAIPSNYLSKLLSQNRPLTPLSDGRDLNSKGSRFDVIGEKITTGVLGTNITYDGHLQDGHFSFSLFNRLRESIKNVHCLIVFYDQQGGPLDVQMIRYPGVIPAGLAKRITGRVDNSVERLNSHSNNSGYSPPPRSPKGKVEFRVLNFDISE